jgi:hypothetical protein
MEIHIKTDASDRRLVWIALGIVAIAFARNIGSLYLW